jgi:hypothetical protein
VRFPFAGRDHDLRKGVAFPPFYTLFVSFTGPAARLLRRPFEALPQKTADVIVMQRHAEVSVNEFGDALRGPQLVGPAMRLRSLAEQAFEFPLLVEGQARRGAGVRSRGEAVRKPFEFKPAVDGTGTDAHNARDIPDTIAGVNGMHGLTSSKFQGAGGSIRSAHAILYVGAP